MSQAPITICKGMVLYRVDMFGGFYRYTVDEADARIDQFCCRVDEWDKDAHLWPTPQRPPRAAWFPRLFLANCEVDPVAAASAAQILADGRVAEAEQTLASAKWRALGLGKLVDALREVQQREERDE